MFNELTCLSTKKRSHLSARTFLQTFLFPLLVTQICFAQGSWTKIGDMTENRFGHTVDELNGKLYVVGGVHTETSTYPRTTLVYDRSSGEWTQIPLANNKIRNCHTSCIVDGKMYVMGGNDSSSTLSTMDMFDPSTGEWVSKNSMSTDRGLAACASIEGKIYVMGGMQMNEFSGLSTVEVYNTTNDIWMQVADMPTNRWGHSAVALNGKIYVFGGRSANYPYTSVEMYDAQTNTWTTKSNMPTARYCLTTCVLDDNIFAIGGWFFSGGGPFYDKVEIYNPESDEWLTERPLPVARAVLASIVLDGKIYVYGGARTGHPCIGTSAIYELSYDDIFAQQPYVDKPYTRKNIDSVLFRTRFSNIYNHPFTPRLIHANSDSTQIDSLTLFDDGIHGDSLANDGLYGGYIPSRQIEDFYFLSVSTIDNQTNKYYNTPDRCRFTTAGPVVLDSISYTKTSTNYSVKTFLRNQSTNTTITKASVKLICDDPWVLPISSNVRTLSNIPPGGITSNTFSSFSVNYIESLFPGYFNFKVEIMSDDWTYWVDSMQVIITGVDDEVTVPSAFKLEQNFPNQFNPTTTIGFGIPEKGNVRLSIINVLGEEIKVLLNEEKEAGYHSIDFNGSDLTSGVYFYRIQVFEPSSSSGQVFIDTKKMVLLK